MLDASKLLQPSLIFVGKVGSQPSNFQRYSALISPVLTPKCQTRLEMLGGINTLAYLSRASVSERKFYRLDGKTKKLPQ